MTLARVGGDATQPNERTTGRHHLFDARDSVDLAGHTTLVRVTAQTKAQSVAVEGPSTKLAQCGTLQVKSVTAQNTPHTRTHYRGEGHNSYARLY
ncbi:hypothetical protein BaRGS_00000602 [Batillaria attramentaria]|uniref:Uncharacterized protein n=1 Tax=Batillaria attramentaria TaxID=370345 RepID=A0ABD0MA39_9CAEN